VVGLWLVEVLFFDDNDGWHMTAVDLSTNSLKGAHHVHRQT